MQRPLPGAKCNRCKLEQFDAVLEVRNADKSIIYLPRHHPVRGLHISAELRHNAAYLAR